MAAARLISRVFKTFNVELSVESLFHAKNIAQMAVLVTRNRAQESTDELNQILAELESLSEDEANTVAVRRSGA